MKLLNHKLLLLNIFLVVFSTKCYGQTFSPEIQNYTVKDYNADNQNWGIDINENSVVFMANNKGLLKYNGQSWQLLELPKKTIIRSVLCDGDKVYTGSYEEFGFWKQNQLGIYQYTSLTNLFDESHEFKSEEFWQIVKHKDNIVFRSFGGMYVLNEERITYIEGSQNTSQIVVFQDKIIASSLDKHGLLELKGERLHPFLLDNAIDQFDKIRNLTVLKGGLFLFDDNHGGFIHNSNELKSISKDVNQLLSDAVINKVVDINPNVLAFGSIKNGIIIYDTKTFEIKTINKSLGLENNTVLGLKFYNGNLWGALDNGICRLNIESPIQYYRDLTGVLGTVYDISFFNSKYYLASNTGVYSFSDKGRLQPIKKSQDHVWDLSIIDKQLFCGHNKGTFYIVKDELKQVDSLGIGVYNYFKTPIEEAIYLQANYSGIGRLFLQEGEWTVKQIEGVNFPVDNIVFESDSVIWVTHAYKGVYRIELDKAYLRALNIVNYSNNENFKQNKTNMFKVNNQILFYNANQWFKFSKEDGIIVYKPFKKFTNKTIVSSEVKGNWFIDENNKKSLLLFSEKNDEIFKIRLPGNKQHLVPKYEKVIKKNDSIRIINLNDGFAVFNINTIKEKKGKELISSPIVERVYSKYRSFSTQDSILEISFNDAKYLSFEVYSPNSYEVQHEYELSGAINQKDLFQKGKFTLQNLRFGNYSLSILNSDNKENVLKIDFKVLPPWYLSGFMRFVYVLLLLSIIYTIYKINKIKIRREQLAIKKKHIRETQKRINRLEKENLEKEVRTKKRELASTTDSVIRKNETIMVLMNELERLYGFSPNEARTKKILEASKKDVGNSNDWKIFESNFNELNRDFFKKLTNLQPKLTTKDLRLCAYIKTGLTSKKIAPLMGISLRGIELHRYRLRKKLNIPSNDNLANFLRNL